MILSLSVLATVLPTMAYAGLIYWVDRYEKEPLPLLVAAFSWGAVPSILFSLIAGPVLSAPFYSAGPYIGDFVSATAVAPVLEESIKGLMLVIILFRWRHEIDSPLDGLVYGAMVGMGFAMVENFVYFVTVYREAGPAAWQLNILLRALVFGLNHALYSGMTGLGIAVGRLARRRALRIAAPFLGWSFAVFLHSVHNASASLGGVFCLVLLANDFGGIFLTLLIIGWSIWQEGHWIRTYLDEEVELGLITAEQHRSAASSWTRGLQSVDRLLRRGPRAYLQGRRFYHRCAELAYKKHHYALFRHPDDLERAARLRQQIMELAAGLD